MRIHKIPNFPLTPVMFTFNLYVLMRITDTIHPMVKAYA